MYKHKLLNVTAELSSRYPPFYKTSDGVDLPLSYVEMSNDWEEAKPLYETTDGVKRYGYQTEWFLIQYKGTWKFVENGENGLSPVSSRDVKEGKVPYYKIFSTKEAAEKWMEVENEKLKPKALLKTVDGVDIFFEESFYSVYIGSPSSIAEHIAHGTIVIHPSYKYFSTKQKAEEYLENNKKQYSIEDIKKAFLDSGNVVGSKLYNEVTNCLKNGTN